MPEYQRRKYESLLSLLTATCVVTVLALGIWFRATAASAEVRIGFDSPTSYKPDYTSSTNYVIWRDLPGDIGTYVFADSYQLVPSSSVDIWIKNTYGSSLSFWLYIGANGHLVEPYAVYSCTAPPSSGERITCPYSTRYGENFSLNDIGTIWSNMTSSELRSNIYWGAQNSPFSYNSFNWSVSGWDYDTTGSEGFPSISFFGLSGCGDGFLEDGEECDDGGTANGDGCSSSCAVEDGWWCEGEPSECGYCGDDSCGGGEDCLSCPTDCALTATVVKPEESAEYAPGTVPYRVASNICASEHPDETPYMWLWAEWWDGDSWEDGGSRLYEWDGFLTAGSYGNCGEGLTYGWGSLPVDPMAEWIQADGDWRMTAQVVSGEIEGEWSPAVEFSVSTGMGNPGDPGWFGDSTTVSWGEFPGSDGDDEGTWQAFVDAAEEGKPTCSFNLFSGDDGDGLSCVWSWIRYGIIPPEDAPRNIIASVWVKVRTRWPLAYIPQVASSIYGGMTASGGICPLPDIEGVEVAGMTVPGIDLCAISEEAAGWMDTDDWLSNWIAIAIWAMTGYLWYRAARHFCGA